MRPAQAGLIKMPATTLIEKTRQHVESTLVGKLAAIEGSGHDWWHIYRVWNTAKNLADDEGADRTIVELAALLHDMGDWKFHDGDETIGPALARAWLEQQNAGEDVIAAVCEIIGAVSYKGSGVPTPMKTLEGKVVQDADRLDAIGAIGIARAFAYGGYAKRLIYHPDQSPTPHETFAEYKMSKSHTINHFHEKLLLLKDRMNTSAGKKLAAERHRFMEDFLRRFFKEWDGEY
jgi:uncharacterized protein